MITTTGGRSSSSSGAACARGPPSGPAVGGVVLQRLLVVDVIGGADDLDLLVELVGEHLDGLVGQRLGERRHLAQRHELLDDLGRADPQVLRDVPDGRARPDADDVGPGVRVLGDRRGDLFEDLAAPATAAARRTALRPAARRTPGPTRAARAVGAARGLGVDDDTPPAGTAARGAFALHRRTGGALLGARDD